MTLPDSLSLWPEEAIEDWRERAAIREVLGRMPRARAEELAEEDVRIWHARHAARWAAFLVQGGPCNANPSESGAGNHKAPGTRTQAKGSRGAC